MNAFIIISLSSLCICAVGYAVQCHWKMTRMRVKYLKLLNRCKTLARNIRETNSTLVNTADELQRSKANEEMLTAKLTAANVEIEELRSEVSEKNAIIEVMRGKLQFDRIGRALLTGIYLAVSIGSVFFLINSNGNTPVEVSFSLLGGFAFIKAGTTVFHC